MQAVESQLQTLAGKMSDLWNSLRYQTKEAQPADHHSDHSGKTKADAKGVQALLSQCNAMQSNELIGQAGHQLVTRITRIARHRLFREISEMIRLQRRCARCDAMVAMAPVVQFSDA